MYLLLHLSSYKYLIYSMYYVLCIFETNIKLIGILDIEYTSNDFSNYM